MSTECLPPIQTAARPKAQLINTLNRRNFARESHFARMSEPEPGEERTALTISMELEPQSESDQGCEPATAAAKGILVELDMEYWLM